MFDMSYFVEFLRIDKLQQSLKNCNLYLMSFLQSINEMVGLLKTYTNVLNIIIKHNIELLYRKGRLAVLTLF